jgi:hypothetical protein
MEPAFIDLFMENLVHHGLESSGRIAQAKEHDQWFETTSVGDECGFPLVTFPNPDIVVSPVYIKLGEDLGVLDLVDEFGDQRERVVILDSHAI